MITLAMLRHSLRIALSFVHKNELPLEHLQGVYFDFVDSATVKLAGTNGQRIVVVRLSVPHGAMNKPHFFMSVERCKALLEHFPDIPSGTEVSMFLLPGQLMLTCENDVFCADDTPVEYPDYASIFSRNVSTPYPGKHYNYDYLHEALTIVAPVTDGSVYLDMHTQDYLRIRPGVHEKWKGIIGIDIAIAALSRAATNPKGVV